jgi:ABC-type dipeptide/oligopeptide/nickel transport system ATPase subunit
MKTSGDPSGIRVGIVGPCTSGKTTLIANLASLPGIELRHIAQEHSYVPSMWQRISHPAWLVFLDVSYSVSLERKNLDWTVSEYEEQQRRLAHAREHAHFYLMTDNLTPEEVAEQVQKFLSRAVPHLAD